MKVYFEFMTQFRENTGTCRCAVVFRSGQKGQSSTLIQALVELEKRFAGKGFRVQKDGIVIKGVMIFIKTPSGGLIRVKKPECQVIENGQRIALAAAMAGG